MTKKSKQVEETKEVKPTKEMVRRVSTENLLKSDKVEDKISGVARIIGECVAARSKEKKQSIVNKVSKSTLSLRSGKVSEDDLELCKQLINASWTNIKDCKKDDKVKLSDDALKLYELILTFGRKSATDTLPDEITF